MSTVPTWRERAGLPPDYEVHSPSSVERALLAEVADLRNALAAAYVSSLSVTNAEIIDLAARSYVAGDFIFEESELVQYVRRILSNATRVAVASAVRQPRPVPKDAKLWADGIWRDSSGNVLGPAA